MEYFLIDMYKTHKNEITQLVVTLPCEHIQLTQTMMKSMTKVSSGYVHNKSYKRNSHMHLGTSPDQLAVLVLVIHTHDPHTQKHAFR